MQFLPDASNILGGAAQLIGGTVSLITGAILIIMFGIYLATEPSRYYQSTLAAFPASIHAKLAATGSDINTVLRRWLVGQIIMMFVIGFSSYAVLTVVGVPLALTLAFVAGLTAFLPYVGPLIGGGTMILVAFMQGTTTGLIVLGFYIVLQLMESYVLTPLIQSKAIFVPPAVVVLAQVIFGVMFGLIGIALATPLAAVIAVLVRRLHFGEGIELN